MAGEAESTRDHHHHPEPDRPPAQEMRQVYGDRDDPGQPPVRSRFGGAVLLPEHYVWLIFVSSLDVFFTTIILYFGGTEVNPIADYFLARYDVWGLIGLKFVSISVVICLCEVIGRLRFSTARRFAFCAIIISCIPVVVAIVQLVAFAWVPE